jgi:gliding motility-associated-like protein
MGERCRKNVLSSNIELLMNQLRYILFFCLSLMAISASATHNRAGEITYEHVSGFTYRIKIQTCTKSSSQADRPYLKIKWGDEPANVAENDLDSLARTSITYISTQDAQINIYYGLHTYSGPGTFKLTVEDPNRNSDIVNIPTSVQVPFFIETFLVINPVTGHNNSVQLTNPPKEQACINQPWVHNPGAYDPDGDSLYYSLVPCIGAGGVDIFNWVLPSVSTTQFPSDIFAIDSQTGDVTWVSPPMAGEYNIAILIQEFRNGVFVGSVLRDMQIDVINCPNQAPVIQPLPDYCITAGDTLMTSPLVITDPNAGDIITVSAFGGPVSQTDPLGFFNPVSKIFRWIPQCQQVRLNPYQVSFEAYDNGNIPLSDIETINIRVVAPRVENPVATANGNSIVLTWDQTPCHAVLEDIADQIVYKIYRKVGGYGFVPDVCETGVPAYTGYTYLGQSIGLHNVTYTDNNVQFGVTYCYMVVTVWPDGAESYASEEFCETLSKNMPVITKVSIGITDFSAGNDTIWWSPPTELDTTNFSGPYQYKLYHLGNSTPELIYESSISNYLVWGDTMYVHQGLNTLNDQQKYKVEFYSGGVDNALLVATSATATSVFVVPTPGDNRVTLDFTYNTPWGNFQFDVYRRGPSEGVFSLLTTTVERSYVDTALINNETYCYKVLAHGSYFSDMVPYELLNWSQEICAKPYDQTPPCPPVISLEGSCDEGKIYLTWSNANRFCADDVTAYNLWDTPIEGGEMTLLASIDASSDTNYTWAGDSLIGSIAGCFAVSALDSLNLWPDGNLHQNESALSTPVCKDNCPFYFLPDVFTPNKDGVNDTYVPINQRYVQDVVMDVYNRWGKRVFHSTDKKLGWNGADSDSGEMVTDGVYFYTITVNTIRLTGIVPESFSGTITILDGDAQPVSE